MAKVISYKFLSCEVNQGTEEQPVMERIILDKAIECPNQTAFDTNYPIAKKEAISGIIEVSGEFDPEPDTASTDDVLNALLGVTV